MYDDLVKSLRQCADASCAGCKNELVEIGCRGLLQREAANAIEELSKPHWIPVTKMLPKENGEYLVSGEDKVWVCEFIILGDVGGWCNSARNPCVKYWMPLPKPPKGEENGNI